MKQNRPKTRCPIPLGDQELAISLCHLLPFMSVFASHFHYVERLVGLSPL